MICFEEKLVYLHPSKTAGTSVEISLMSSLTGLAPEQLTPRIAQLFGCWDSTSTQHWPYAKMLEAYPFIRNWKKIVTLRHPYARAISEFKYQLAGNCIKPGLDVYRRRDIDAAVKSGVLWSNGFAWHGQPQFNYLGPDVQILRFEHLAEDWDRVVGIGKLVTANKSNSQLEFELAPESKAAIQRRFPKDFEDIGYSS